MARLPDPKLKKVNVNEEYDGVEKAREHFFKVFAELFHKKHISERKESKEIA